MFAIFVQSAQVNTGQYLGYHIIGRGC